MNAGKIEEINFLSKSSAQRRKKILFRFLPNFLLAVLITISFIVIDQIYRIYHGNFVIGMDPRQLPLLLLTGLGLSFFRKDKNFLWVYGVIVFFMLLQLIHYAYFGTRISAIEISLFFTHTRETLEIFSDLLTITWIPLLICGSAFALIFFSRRKFSKRVRSRHAWICLVLAFSYPSAVITAAMVHGTVGRESNSTIGDRVNDNDDLWAYSQKLILFYLMYTLPHEAFGYNALQQPVLPPPPLQIKNPNVNVVLIMGESLTGTHLSSYGYPRPTTPYLDSLKKQKNVMFKNGISAGVSTDVSLPMFFNMALRPDSTKQISSGRRNLFKLAHLNGFDTRFVSTQSDYHLAMIRPYLSPSDIQNYADSSLFGGNRDKNVLDGVLAAYVKTLSFAQPTFLVLHQRGSHANYADRYPASGNFFQSSHADFQQTQIDRYDNSVRYTDSVIQQIVASIKEQTQRPTYVIFTSDHGESLGDHGRYGHNNLDQLPQRQVPIIIIALNGANLDFIKIKDREDINPRYMSHYELSQIIAHLLGYQIDHYSTQKSAGYFVTGNTLSGLSSYEQMTQFMESPRLFDEK